MDENYQAETMEAAETADVTTEADLSAFDEGWDGDGQTVSVEAEAEVEEAGEDSPEADQQTDENAEDNKPAEEAAAPEEPPVEEETQQEKADQLFTLKHLDETRVVKRDEVISLAQKGMDYDRKVGKLNNELAEFRGFFEELAGASGLSTEQFIDSVRAKMLIAEENRAGREISEADAVFRVQKARADKAKAKAEEEQRQAQQAREAEQRKAAEAVKAFTAAFPGVAVTDIPKSVWEDMNRSGGDLLGAYTRHTAAQTAKENEQLKKQIEALKNNAKNTSRSIGSKKAAGSAKTLDAFDVGWDSI